MKNNIRIGLRLASCVVLASFSAHAAATIKIVNGDLSAIGFNDPTVVPPIGGNPGTTLGQQRMNVFTAAASKWGSILSSSVTIRVNATWSALTCSASSAVLGSAGAGSIWRDFANAPAAGRWYPKALANKLAGYDISSATVDISANFNVNLGQPGCLDGLFFYLGLDNAHGGNIDLFSVLLHEFGHGLGFTTFTNGASGSFVAGYPSIWDDFLLDNTTNKTWSQMTAAERAASAINYGHLVWSGANVTFAVPGTLQVGADPLGRAVLYAPGSFQPGSSVSHYDTTMTPNQLMEPALNANLVHEVAPPFDLTFPLLQDIGWSVGTAQFPDLSITKSHSGNFAQGQAGATYSVLVSNIGNVPTSGVVSVTDTLPAGLTATAISGSGWTCTLASALCTRSDALPPAASYPVITVTVNVAGNAASQITNRADAWGGGSVPATANDVTTILGGCSFSMSPNTTGAAFVAAQKSIAVNSASGCSWQASSNSGWITIVSGASGNGSGTLSYSIAANLGVSSRTGTITVAGQTFTVKQAGRVPAKAGILRTIGNLIAEDVNGSLGWDSADRAGSFGIPGDVVVFGDWDGSGTTKMGIFRASGGLWALDMNGNGVFDAGIDVIGTFGQPGDVPIVGDWTGDGKTKIGIYRPASALFALDMNGNLGWDGGDKAGTYGQPGDTPLIGDWIGDGKARIGIFRGGLWALDMNGNIAWDSGTDAVGLIGQAGDTPLLGDWNGDGRTKVGIYRSTWAMFGLDYNGSLSWDATDRVGVFGSPGDTPVLGDWDASGITRVGIYRANQALWAFDMNGNVAWDGTDRAGSFGQPGDLPVTGRWQ